MNTINLWIGCTECRNGGKLVGDWFDLSEVANVTTDTLHKYAELNIASGEHEELDVFDFDNLPEVFNEITINEALELWQVLEDVLESDREAFIAYSSDQWYEKIQHWSYTDFLDAYVGEYEDMRDYTYTLMDDLMPSDAPELLQRYFDYAAFERDLLVDHAFIDLPNGNVAVFHY